MMRILAMLLLTPPILAAQSYYNFRTAFLERKGSVNSMELTLAETAPLTRTYDFRLHSTSGDSITGRIRIPNGNGPFPAALLCVGIETGKEVIDMIERQDSVVLMAVDYPFEGEWSFDGWKAVRTVFALRRMGFRTVPLLLNCLEWLFTRPEVDGSDVTVAAVSFGSFTGIPAAVIDPRVKQLVVVQGGAGLSTVIAHNSERWGSPLPAWLSGWLGGMILAPFEPKKYIPHLAPRKLLMVSGEGDTFFPPRSAYALLDAAGDPKEIVWQKTAHVMPGEKELIKELTNVVARRLYGASD